MDEATWNKVKERDWENATRYRKFDIRQIRNLKVGDRIWVIREGAYNPLNLTVTETSPDVQITEDENGKGWLLDHGPVPGDEPRVTERSTGRVKGLIDTVISRYPRYTHPDDGEGLPKYIWMNEDEVKG